MCKRGLVLMVRDWVSGVVGREGFDVMTSTMKDSTTMADSAKAAMELRLPPDSLVAATAERLVEQA